MQLMLEQYTVDSNLFHDFDEKSSTAFSPPPSVPGACSTISLFPFSHTQLRENNHTQILYKLETDEDWNSLFQGIYSAANTAGI